MTIQLIEAHGAELVPRIRELFEEYAGSLEIDLCFQNFKQELDALPGAYAPPTGRLLLARAGNVAVGCVALRKIEDAICEMKRLYVRPAFRGQGLGRKLAMAVIDGARDCGYASMRLDTLSSMGEAIGLYESLGFVRTEAYYVNPNSCTVFMMLAIQPSARRVDSPAKP